MSLFTTSEANACTIVRMEKETTGSSVSWIIGVKDSDNNYYDTVFSDLGSNPSKEDIKTAIINYLKTIEKMPNITTVNESISDKGLGETLA